MNFFQTFVTKHFLDVSAPQDILEWLW
jgi:hypothetical protein